MKRKMHRERKIIVNEWTITLYGPEASNDDDEQRLRTELTRVFTDAVDRFSLPDGFRIKIEQ